MIGGFNLQGIIATFRKRPLLWRTALILSAVSAAFTFHNAPFFRALDNSILNARFSATPQNRDFDSALIAIDTASLQAYPDWPWPRSFYGELLDRLNEAGAKQVAFDIDFSSRGQGDERFAEAIENSSVPVYLATFRQEFQGAPGVIAEISPNPTLKGHARLATTTFPIDEDGIVREMPAYDPFSHGNVPQLALALNEREPFEGLRTINFAHDLRELPVISFVDVLDGADISEYVRGRTVFVGSTAIELGDEFAIPRHGLQSGVILNAMAYETIRHHTEKYTAPLWVSVGFVVIGMLFATQSISRRGIRLYTILNLSALAAIFVIGLISQAVFDLVIQTGMSHISQLAMISLMLCAAADDYAAKIFRSHMHVRKHAAILDTMMSSNHDGIVLVNRLGRVESCNEQAAKLLGSECRKMIDQPIEIAAPSLTEADYSDGPALIEMLDADGDMQYVEVSRAEVELPMARSRYEQRREVRFLKLFTMHDLTAQKQAEQAERDAKEMHAQASAAKSTLISTMSHELRTPLNSVCGFADLISQAAFGEHSAPEYTEFGEMIGSSGRQLLGVVNDMLLATQLQSGDQEIRTQTFSLEEASKSALDRASARQAWTSPTVKIEVGETEMSGDYDLTVTALYHLLDNASKFAGKDGTVWIRADDETHTLIVEDDGPGPRTDKPEKLTALFEQGDGSRTRSHEGCGLGLFLVDGIFKLQGGRLELGEREGGGFRAEAHLPAEIWKSKSGAVAA
ncbi:CHASE2 domain-containing protein [Parvularcula marina]|uniref:CHASE2 domain-containing protein n=1 Tax=Parvularcula marina TaxID=2292771 RepID=UPI0035130CE2